jgi:hypothetical protein
MESFDTPILFVIFNRPDTTRRVFEAIRRAKPSTLFVAADGPRPDRPGEAELVAAVRQIVDEGVDWECRVEKRYAANNQGCRVGVANAIDWFFSQVPAGIILEDDCLPDPTFFPFCAALLAKYETDERIMMIGGANYQDGRKRGDGSYYFSKFCHIWGWATWRRAWRFYDRNLAEWPAWRDRGGLLEYWGDRQMARSWVRTFDRVARGEIDTWDYQWVFTVWFHGGLSIVPNQNLISNIGFGAAATHTTGESRWANRPTAALPAITDPSEVRADEMADRYTFRHLFAIPLSTKIWNKLKSLFS